MGRSEDLPPKVLDNIIEILFNEAPKDLVSNILGSVSKPIHESACRTIFGSTARPLIIPDDARLFNVSGSNPLLSTLRGDPISALIANPERYGPYVKCLSIVDPTVFAPLDAQDGMPMSSSNLGLFNGEFDIIAEEEEEEEIKRNDDDDVAENGEEKTRKPRGEGQVRPLDAETIKTLLSACEELEELSWNSSYPPPDGLCEDLVSYNTKLNRFAYKPNSQLVSASSSATKWDAPSLPLLAPLITSCNLAHLTLTRLTQTGAQSLSLLLDALAEEAELPSSSGASGSWLQSLDLNFVWLDDPLCERIVKASRRTLKQLTLGTQGTKLTDVGIVTLLEGLEKLEEFGLVHVEGRLSKTLWTKLAQDTIPTSLNKLTIGIPDVGPSHSWSLDHLRSLSSFPFANIRHITIVRTSVSTEGPSIDRGNNLQPVPREVLKALTEDEAAEITSLECDWWSWSAEDLKVVLERCSKLKSVKLAFDAPFAKFLGLAGSIASASDLRKISVLIPVEHVPSPPPSPSVATPGNPLSPNASPMINFSSRTQLTPLRGNVGLPPSPTTSTIMRRDSMSKSYTAPSSLPSSYFNGAPSEAAPNSPSMSISGSPLASLNGSLPSLDHALPLLRDMKKLFKRCAALREVEWVGRGLWTLDTSCRSSSTAKTTSLANIKVDFQLPRSLSVTAYEEEYERKRIEEEAVKWEWSPSARDRVGQEWVGEAADETAKEREKLMAEKEKEKEGIAEQATNGRSPVRRRAPTLPSVVTTPPAPTPTQVPSALGTNGNHRRAATSSSNTRRSSAGSNTPTPNGFDQPTPRRAESQSSSSSTHSHHSQDNGNNASELSRPAPTGSNHKSKGSHGGRGRGRSASEGERRHRAPRNGGGNEGASRPTNGANGEHGEHRREGYGRGSHRKPGSSGRGHTAFIGAAHSKRAANGAPAHVAAS